MSGRRTTRPRAETAADNAGIRDVRRWRAALVNEGGGTLEGLWELLKGGEASRAASRNGSADHARPGRSKANPRAERPRHKAVKSRQRRRS